MKCENCGTVFTQEGARTDYSSDMNIRTCPHCGRPVGPDFVYCPYCGKPM